MRRSPFISNSCGIMHSKCSSRLSVSCVCEQVKKLLLLLLRFLLTVTKKKEGVSGHHFSPLLGVGTPSSSVPEITCVFGSNALTSLTPRTAEPPSHLPAQLGDIIIYFIIIFFLYTSKYFWFIFFYFHLRARSRAD